MIRMIRPIRQPVNSPLPVSQQTIFGTTPSRVTASPTRH